MKLLKPVFKSQNALMSKWVVDNFPENYEQYNYVEPFCGATQVLINKEKSALEIINDIDPAVVKIYQAIRDEPKEYVKRLNKLKFAKETFEKAISSKQSEDYLDFAVNEYIARKMSKNGEKEIFVLGQKKMKPDKSTLDYWVSSITSISDLAKRLNEVHIFNKDAKEVIEAFDGTNTLVYCDPPYLYETNVSKKVYMSEMSTDDHIALAHVLNKSISKIILSGRVSPLYKRLYKDWNIAKATNQHQKKMKNKKEIIWKNF